jgi:ubiquinone/menaquinone biosynthesis C-methylase UbiE
VKTTTGFDFLAPTYDTLAQLVFGKSITDSQTWFLNQIPPGSKVLILGGGTGWLLEKLYAYNTTCEIWYIDASDRMLAMAKQRIKKNKVHFIQGTEEDIPATEKFNVVITNFYLDLFSDKTLWRVVQKISSHTTSLSSWHVTDFVRGKPRWHSWMLKIMYMFFRSICSIEAKTLPNWCKTMKEHTWEEVDSNYWYGGFIKGSLLKRASTIR